MGREKGNEERQRECGKRVRRERVRRERGIGKSETERITVRKRG